MSLKRRIGYETQSRLVIRSLFQRGLLPHHARETLNRRTGHLVADELRADRDAVVLCDVQVIRTTLPVFLFTVTSATMRDLAVRVQAEAVAAAVTTSPDWRFDAATLGFQPAAIVAPSMTARYRAPITLVGSMFLLRNAIGSMFTACAISSTICSLAKNCCGAFGARRKLHLRAPPYSGWVFASTRRGYVYAVA